MFDESSASQLLTEIKSARESIAKTGEERQRAFKEQQTELKKFGAVTTETSVKQARLAEEITALTLKCQALEESHNELCKKMNRPGADGSGGDLEVKDRLRAIDYLRLKQETKFPKLEPDNLFNPSPDQISEAVVAGKAISALMHCADLAHFPDEYRKSLSAFSFGNNGFIMRPEMSDRILSCLIDQTDVAGLMASTTIAGPSIRFMIDNVVLDAAAWACESACFANNPQANLSGLGEMEIKPETLRYILCATRDVLEDASMDVEQWMLGKVQRAFRLAISNALISGDGNGRPVGILNPNSGIPVCDTSPSTPPGTFTWQDLVMLKYNVPMQYHGTGAGGRYFMNQNTFAFTLTMSDAIGRPIFASMPHETGSPLMLAGSPVTIVTQMPDVEPGSTPIAWGNWAEVYMLVHRKAVTMQQDPYSAGFCILYKFESRIGGGIICPGAARLLRIQ